MQLKVAQDSRAGSVGGIAGDQPPRDGDGGGGSGSGSSSGSNNSSSAGFKRGPTLVHAVAGVCAGVASTSVLHPFDLIKTRLQVALPHHQAGSSAAAAAAAAAASGSQPAPAPPSSTVSAGGNGSPRQPAYRGQRLTYRGLASLVVNVVKHEGAAGLYKGVTPNVLGNATAWGSYFFGYNLIKNTMRGPEEHNQQLSHWQHLSGATAAGIATLLITNPIWLVKTRMCLQTGADQSNYRGVAHALRTIVKEEGPRGLYKGLVPGLIGTTHGGFQFVAYEDLKKRFNRRANRHPEAQLTTLEYIACATTSKVFAGTVTYPYQVVRARQQQRRVGSVSTAEVVRQVRQQWGLVGFYHGLAPYLIRVMPATCITFVVYEHLSHFLRRSLEANRGTGERYR